MNEGIFLSEILAPKKRGALFGVGRVRREKPGGVDRKFTTCFVQEEKSHCPKITISSYKD